MTTSMIDTQEQDNMALAPGLRDSEDLLEEINANLKDGRIHLAEWRKQARECYDFYAGKQWSEQDRLLLEQQGRPAVVFNRMARTINAVSGLEIQNRQEIRFQPRQVTDAGYSDNMTQAAKWVRETCDAEDEESEAFQDDMICGMGWIGNDIDYDGSDAQQVKINLGRLDPLTFVYDPNAKKPNIVDARWIAHIKEMTRKEYMEKFPGKSFASGSFWGSDVDGVEPHDATNAWRYENDQTDKLNRNKTTWVAQYQYWEKQPYYKVQTPSGKIADVPEERFVKIKKELDDLGMSYVKYQKKVYKECFVNGKEILEEKDLGCSHFTMQAITGYRDRNSNTWFGLGNLMMDPQRWANKLFSQIQHIVNTGAKNGYMAEVGAFKNKRDAEASLAKPGAIIELNPGGKDKILPLVAPQYPDGVDRLLQYAISSINDIPGVNLELMGMANRDQAIGLEESRKQAGVTILAPLFNSLRRYRKIEGRLLAYYIREYLPEGELIRIVGDEGAKYIPLMKDKLAFDYDIIVDDAPTSPNMKERIYPILNQSIQMALQAGIPIPPEVLDYAPLPDSLIQKWKQKIMSGQQDPNQAQMKQIQMMLAQLEVGQKQADIQKTTSEVTKNYATAEQQHALGINEAALAQQRMDAHQADQQISYEGMLKEQARKDLEMVLNQRRKHLELQLKAKHQQNSSMQQ